MKKLFVRIVLGLCMLLPVHGYTQSSKNYDSDHEKVISLESEVSQLRTEVSQLKTEIQQLRRLLATQPQAKTYSTPRANSYNVGHEDAVDTGYWCTKSSNKRHNPSCRYYKTSNGHPCGPNDGIPCKLCGG